MTTLDVILFLCPLTKLTSELMGERIFSNTLTWTVIVLLGGFLTACPHAIG